MDDRELKLACLQLVYPKGDPGADPEHYIEKAKALYKFVSDRRGRPPKADKPEGPAN